jgi:hypothetical protein
MSQPWSPRRSINGCPVALVVSLPFGAAPGMASPPGCRITLDPGRGCRLGHRRQLHRPTERHRSLGARGVEGSVQATANYRSER